MLKFTVRNQNIRRTDLFRVVADSQNYLYAEFEFGTNEWNSVTKTAIFKRTDSETAYEEVIGTDGICQVPNEVLQGEGIVEVSAFGGSLITVDKATFKVSASGYIDDAGHSVPPTPSVYEQITERLLKVENMAVSAENLPQGSPATVTKTVDESTGGYLLSFGIPKGDQGEQGPQGDVGPQGAQGAQGPQGERGLQGLQGEKGDKGDTGAQGPKGDKGDTGATGPKGDTGNAGPQGVKGDTGPQGPQGVQGFSPVITVEETATTYEITLQDATSTETISVRKDGAKGDTGNGIASAVLNNNYTLTLTFTDGTSYTTPSIRGAQGETYTLTNADKTEIAALVLADLPTWNGGNY